MNQNKTKEDAFARVMEARMGSMGFGSTDEYLECLHAQILDWARRVQDEISDRARANADAEEAESESRRPDMPRTEGEES